jgi:hypothetical protein
MVSQNYSTPFAVARGLTGGESRFDMRESEEYQVGLSDVTVLELVIVPDISRDRLAPRSRVCGCLDWLRDWFKSETDAPPFPRRNLTTGAPKPSL